jgi:hypothetical protein
MRCANRFDPKTSIVVGSSGGTTYLRVLKVQPRLTNSRSA